MISDRDTQGRGYDLGMKAEAWFRAMMESYGWDVIEATKEQNMYEHWDFMVYKDVYIRTVDVKAQKRLSRWDKGVDNEWVWVELKNNAGYPGWAYQTQANLLAFERGSMFYLVTPSDLRSVVETKVQDIQVQNSRDAKYKLFTRKGRKDLLTLVRYDDLPTTAIMK